MAGTSAIGHGIPAARAAAERCVTLDELVKVAASILFANACRSCAGAVSGMTLRYASTTSTSAPVARNASGITSRETSARASKIFLQAVEPFSPSMRLSDTYDTGIKVIESPISRPAAAVTSPTAVTLSPEGWLKGMPNSAARLASARTVFALVYESKETSAASRAAKLAGG